MPDAMKPFTTLITFDKGGTAILVAKQRVTTPEEIRAAIESAYSTFRMKYGDVSLFDGVNVTFDKED